jgi:hypothetical protein
MTPVFQLCDDYVTRQAVLDPVAAGMGGITGSFHTQPRVQVLAG